MAGESVSDTSVHNHLGGELTSEGTVSSEGKILGGDMNIVSNNGLNSWDVKGSWGNNNIDLLGVELELVEDISGVALGERHGAIALPVSSDHQSSHLEVCFVSQNKL